MNAAGVLLGGITIPFLSTWAILFRGPSGYLAPLTPIRWRARYRNRRTLIRRQQVPRRQQGSQKISKWLRLVVYKADRYRCVGCHRRAGYLDPGETMQIDHRVPWIWGGLTCLWNCFTLCSRCNERKSAWWQDRDGKVHGGRYGNRAEGLRIFRVEGVIRLSPWRCARAAIAILTTR